MRTSAFIALGGAVVAWACSAAAGQCQFGWDEQQTQSGPSGRNGHAMVYDSVRGRTVLFGGVDGHELGDTWEWYGGEWHRVDIPGPSPRRDHAMAFDSARGVTVLFGGSAPGIMNDTWEYDGAAWRQVAVGGPWARYMHSMAYDSARGVVVMFGSVSPTDTWEWDGYVWTKKEVATPPNRYNSSMVYDSRRGVTVLFGGAGSEYDPDTWEWDGSTWTRRSIPGPSPRSRLAMVFDEVHGFTLLFGGHPDGGPVSDETWAYTGSSWFRLMTPGPSARNDHAMAFDSIWGRVVLFGGLADPRLGDTWELGPGEPPVIIAGPAAQAATAGEAVVLMVEASADLALSYRWRRDGDALADGPVAGGAIVSGSTTSELRLDGVRWTDEGSYDVVVSTVCGAASAGPALVTVECPIDFTRDGLLDFGDYLAFLTFYTLADPRADLTGDGQVEFPDYLEFLNAYEAGC